MAPMKTAREDLARDEVLKSVNKRQGLPQVGGEPISVHFYSSWSSRTADLHRFKLEPGREDILVKLLHKREDAWGYFQVLEQMANALAGLESHGIRCFHPLSCSTELGSVVMPYVSGKKMGDLLRNPSQLAGSSIDDLASKAGALLAHFHDHLPRASASQREEAWIDVGQRLVPITGTADFAADLKTQSTPARSYGDFHPGHLIIDSTGNLVPIDPSGEDRSKFIHRDIAWFKDGLFMAQLHPPALLRHPSALGSSSDLADSFVSAYFSALVGPRQALSRLDLDVIAAIEAFLVQRRIRTLLRSRLVLRLLYYAPPLWYRLSSLKAFLRRSLGDTF